MRKSELEQIRDEYLRNENDGTPASYRRCREIAADNFWAVLTAVIDLLEPAPPKQSSIADHYPAGFIDEPCSHCLSVSEDVVPIISKIDTAVGMLTVPSMDNKLVFDAKEILIEASVSLGDLCE